MSKYPALFSELLRRGWSIEELEGVAGKNLLRTFTQVEKVLVRDFCNQKKILHTLSNYVIMCNFDTLFQQNVKTKIAVSH